MKGKKLIQLNIINLIMLCLILYMQKILSYPIVIGFIIIWFIFVCVSNYVMINNSKIDRENKLNQAQNGLFANEVKRAKQTVQSVDAREAFFTEADDSNLLEIYEKLRAQIYQNVDFIMKYIESYDYITRPTGQRDRIRKLVAQNEMLVDKLNTLVEHVITVNQAAQDIDTSYIDDLIGALKEVSQTDSLENKYK